MPIAPILPYQVIRNAFITSNVIQLDCVPVDGVERPMFTAGQFMMLHWKDDLGDLIDTPHAYSIASSPHEEGFSFIIKIYGPYTTRLSRELPAGSILHLQGPYGLFILERVADNRIVMLAGGVGIAPFRSMIIDALQYNPNTPNFDPNTTNTVERKFQVLYSNKTKTSFPFMKELDTLSAQHPNRLKIAYTITQEGDTDWNGCRGRWTADSIQQEIGDWAGTTFFVCGPPPFVVEMQDQLRILGVPKEKVKIEKFT